MSLNKLLAPLLANNASEPFDEILNRLSPCRLHLGRRNTFNWPKEAGVYVIRRMSKGCAVYIGLAGRVGKDGSLATKGGLNKRAYRWTPYYFDAEEGAFRYAPEKPSSNSKKAQLEAGYQSSIPYKDLDIVCFKIGENDRLAPAMVEALLLQAHLEQHGCLPEANRQF
jgi:hypothetical protein